MTTFWLKNLRTRFATTTIELFRATWNRLRSQTSINGYAPKEEEKIKLELELELESKTLLLEIFSSLICFK